MIDRDEIGFFITGSYVLDNFSPHAIEFRGKIFNTCEHAYQSSKFIVTNPAVAEEIRNAKSPQQAKEIADANKATVAIDWQVQKITVMEEILRSKLAQHSEVREFLAQSGSKYLYEDSPMDLYWGVGSDKSGQNNLGKLWMKLRSEL